jgi:2-polyprenyl-3-methyl-5-hydroxy-6-metoxy-1,4-benzoquinol methylase
MPDFSKRSGDIEIMDNLQCSGEVVNQTLRELETINTWLGGNQVTLDALQSILSKTNSKQIKICDLGCGGGDMLRLIRKWANKKNLKVSLTGIDANPFIIEFANAHTNAADGIQFEAMDIFSQEFRQKKFDVVIGTLFYHHFADETLSDFFRQLHKQSRIGFIINDIHRHWFAYYSIRWITGIFSKSTMVKFDAPLSVLRAFTKKELIEILILAGIRNYQIRWRWAFRWQVIVPTDDTDLHR